MKDRSDEKQWLAVPDDAIMRRQVDAPGEVDKAEPNKTPSPFYAAFGPEPIPLDYIEYRILQFLSSKPYHAFTPRRIVDAVSSTECPLTETTLPSYIASLRRKLGFFADYIQTVPRIGYRFKE
jgi:DNA-binding response OmpR family regulator